MQRPTPPAESDELSREPLDEALAALGSSPRGLSDDEAKRRLAELGPNEAVASTRHGLRQALSRLTNPLVLILVFACVVSAYVRDFLNAAVILVMVVVSMVIEAFQTHRNARAAEALKARVAQTATVVRDGVAREIARREIVRGDVVEVRAGDMVPADARIIECKDLHVNEAALTGESLPVEKANDGPEARKLLMGSSVVSGTGTALVTATGAHTAFGEIAEQLARRPPPTEFERGISRFGTFIMKTVVFLVLFVFTVSAAQGKDAFESLVFAVALAVGLTPEGLPMITTVTLTKAAIRMSHAKVIVKELAAIQNFGSIDVLCSDKTGTLTTGDMKLEVRADPFGAASDRALELAYVNSHFETGVGNPLDVAILASAKEGDLESRFSTLEKLDEVPFDFERRRVSVVVRKEREVLLVTKGAPEHVLAVATSYERGGEIHPLDAAARARVVEAFEALGREGYRVLAVAFARPSLRSSYSKDDERDLTLAGFVGFVDPPRADAAETLRDLASRGVRVKVITGDSEQVAAHTCDAVGIPTTSVLTGADIDAMSDPALAEHAERADVFARVSPAQKTRVLRALQSRDHVVGFLGDGINDAPSLHAADVGISVANAVDVAKDAAEIILLEPNLRVLLDGVVEGRKAYGNVMKYLIMATSSNFGNMFSMAGAAVLLPFLPMLPMQILLNNAIYDIAQITIPTDRVDESFVREPRRWDIDVIRRVMLVLGPISSVFDFLTFFVLVRVFHANAAFFHTGWFVESLVTQALVVFVIRTAGPALKSKPSAALALATCLVVVIAVAVPFTWVGRFFGFVALPTPFFAFVAAATITYLLVVEVAKRHLLAKLAKSPSVPKTTRHVLAHAHGTT